MAIDYLHNHPEFADLIRIVGGERSIVPALVEKDYCHLERVHVFNLELLPIHGSLQCSSASRCCAPAMRAALGALHIRANFWGKLRFPGGVTVQRLTPYYIIHVAL